MSVFQQVMQETFLAQKQFKDEWEKWKSGKVKKTKSKKEKSKGRVTEPDSVTIARKEYLQKSDEFFAYKLIPLEKKFQENPHSALDEMLDFLSTDILLFRCGYAKESYLEMLKKVDLKPIEVEKVQSVALQMCKSDNIRREFRRWCKLMSRIADREFVLELQQLFDTENTKAQLKAKWTLEMIYQNRTDLRKYINR